MSGQHLRSSLEMSTLKENCAMDVRITECLAFWVILGILRINLNGRFREKIDEVLPTMMPDRFSEGPGDSRLPPDIFPGGA